MAHIDFIQGLHSGTKRNYIQRVVEHDKAACAEIARQFGENYWDGDRSVGYGGYRYDGRWRPIAEQLIRHYGIEPGMRILDVGCGKGYLLYEFQQACPGVEVRGLDISAYAVANAKEEVRPYITVGNASALPYDDGEFDLVISLATLHNLGLSDLWRALSEIQRVGKAARRYIMVESWRSEAEKANLLYWQLTCQSFHAVADWEWLMRQAGYVGDYGFIYFT